MAVFRVEKNSGYTVMSNHHLRNRALSLKAKGLEEYAAAGFEAPQQDSFSIYQLRNEDSTRDTVLSPTTACRLPV